jgi:C-terminal processing protease CtpA/Prc
MSKRGAYWSATIPGTNILYIQYSECVDAPDLPMKDFARKMAEFIDQLKIEKVIVDLRFNGGGNSEVARPLIDVLKNNKQINQKGNLFVLIGRGTFSSAVINAQQLRTETAATLVGEGTGQKPNHYGEMKTLHLKNSGLPVTYSTKYFKFTEKDEPSMMPDVAVTASSEDFFSGRDPGIEAAVGRPAIR